MQTRPNQSQRSVPPRRARPHEQGFALVVTLALMVVILMMVLGVGFTTQIAQANTRNDASATQAEYVAKAGLQKYKTAAFQAFNYYLYNLERYASDLSRYAQCGNLLSAGIDMNRNGDISATEGDLMVGQPANDTFSLGDTSGEYRIDYYATGETILLRSTGKVGSGLSAAQATVQAVVQGQNSGIFANALFAGGGSSMQSINGGAEIWGSVYIRGNPARPDDSVMSANGNFAMHNFYSQNTLASTSRLATTQLDFLKLDAQEQKNMCARLRVASGRVAFGGSNSVGDPSAPADFEAKVHGVNVGRGTSDISRSGNATFYTQAEGAYDLSSALEFPVLDVGANGRNTATATRT